MHKLKLDHDHVLMYGVVLMFMRINYIYACLAYFIGNNYKISLDRT